MRDELLERLRTEFGLQKKEGRAVKAVEPTEAQLEKLKGKVRYLCQSLEIPVRSMHYLGLGMFVGIARVSPRLAINWLETRNSNNRNEKASKIQIMAEDIGEDRWFLTHQGIAFNLDTCELFDGQHRLGAITQANREVPLVVAMYANAESLAKVDLVSPRSFIDQERLVYGRDTDKAMAAVVRAFIYGRGTNREAIGDDTLRNVLLEHGEALEFARDQLMGRGNRTGVTVGPVMAAVARAFYHVNRDKLIRFCEVLHSGGFHEGNAAEEMIVRLKGNLEAKKRGVKSQAANLNIFSSVQYTIDRFDHNKPSLKIKETGEDLHPIPEKK